MLQPLLTMVVFTRRVRQAGSDVAMPTTGRAVRRSSARGAGAVELFAGALERSAASLVGNANLITKVYFPRLVIPLSAVLAGLVDFAIVFVVLLVLMAVYGIAPTVEHGVAAASSSLLAMVTALAVGLWLSALNVLYRDVQYVIPFLVQLWLFVTPVDLLRSTRPREALAVLYALNPMAGVIEGFRWALLGEQRPAVIAGISVVVVVLVLLVGGLLLLPAHGTHLRGRGLSDGRDVVDVEGLGKRYRIGGGARSYRTLRDAIVTRGRSAASSASGTRAPRRAAVRDALGAARRLASTSSRARSLGIIGRNGAGKSTLLKILSPHHRADRGHASSCDGRVGSLLEVGTGFHPELTGRENIFLNGAILGMTRAEIQRKFDEIVAFAEVGRFIDTPVKRYSSGMYVRLAFAVAAHLEPEILIVDEVLAVGDSSSRRSASARWATSPSEGRTVLFVSHNMAAISTLCSRAILLDGGRVVTTGPTSEVVGEYITRGLDVSGSVVWDDPDEAPGAKQVKLHAVASCSAVRPPLTSISTRRSASRSGSGTSSKAVDWRLPCTSTTSPGSRSSRPTVPLRRRCRRRLVEPSHPVGCTAPSAWCPATSSMTACTERARGSSRTVLASRFVPKRWCRSPCTTRVPCAVSTPGRGAGPSGRVWETERMEQEPRP